MKNRIKGFILLILAGSVIFSLTSCTIIFQKGRRSDVEKIDRLSSQLDELLAAKNLLEERLKQEIADKEVRLEMAEKGLVITFVADIVFDSGKASIRPEAFNTLDKVARVLSENLADYNVGIEGHTDNEPITRSGWKSNWELSTARALSVLHRLVDEKDIAGERLSAIGYGEYKPVAENDTKENKKLNRRVEIVVLPHIKKVKDSGVPAPVVEKTQMQEPQENLK